MSEMTVEEMAARLGLAHTSRDLWEDATGIVIQYLHGNGRWHSWPKGRTAAEMETHLTEHAAMLRLYRLRFPEAEAPAVVPASKKRTNVEIVEAAWQKWKATPSRGVPIDYTIEATFAAMLAEAFVADQVEVERG